MCPVHLRARRIKITRRRRRNPTKYKGGEEGVGRGSRETAAPKGGFSVRRAIS